jgi:mono/diheme cytochrome c family protein
MSDNSVSSDSDSKFGRIEAAQSRLGVGGILFVLGSIVVAFTAGLQIGLYHGGFDGEVYYEGNSSPLALMGSSTKAPLAGQAKALSLVEEGKSVYANCVPCHQASGTGIPGQFPPLAGAGWVVGSEKRLVAILLKGVQGPFKVGDAVYNGAMPAWEKALSNRKIAAVASFIRLSWGNSGGEVDEAKVAAVRKEFEKREAPWTEGELLGIPEGEGISVASQPSDVGGSGVAPAQVAAPAATGSGPADKLGKDTYLTVCAACHQPTGKGLAPVFPTLEKTEYVLGSADRLIAIVLKGISGPITVNGVVYSNVMPAQEAVLTDDKISAVLTYVRSSFGNTGSAVSADAVRAMRKRLLDKVSPWTERELQDFDITYKN